jgi:hypothetical protein
MHATIILCGVDYGFRSEWEDDEESEEGGEQLELRATKLLFDSINTYVGQEENIERFCLPLFSETDSDYAVENVMTAFKRRPAMSQIYANYLAKFLDRREVWQFLVRLADDETLFDWQRMWILAALLQVDARDDLGTEAAVKILRDANRPDTLRAIAAIYVGRYGDLDRRKALGIIYPNVSSYIQAAIYYTSRYWRGIERSNARANWGGHGTLNTLLTAAFGS